METLGVVVSIIVGISGLYGGLRHSMKKTILEPLQKGQKELSKADCKNFLVKFLNDKQNGYEQNEAVIKRAYEVKDLYKENHGNSYIARMWEEVMEEQW